MAEVEARQTSDERGTPRSDGSVSPLLLIVNLSTLGSLLDHWSPVYRRALASNHC